MYVVVGYQSERDAIRETQRRIKEEHKAVALRKANTEVMVDSDDDKEASTAQPVQTYELVSDEEDSPGSALVDDNAEGGLEDKSLPDSDLAEEIKFSDEDEVYEDCEDADAESPDPDESLTVESNEETSRSLTEQLSSSPPVHAALISLKKVCIIPGILKPPN